jgi:hypothetical protein
MQSLRTTRPALVDGVLNVSECSIGWRTDADVGDDPIAVFGGGKDATIPLLCQKMGNSSSGVSRPLTWTSAKT